MTREWPPFPGVLNIGTTEVHIVGLSLKTKVLKNEDWLILSEKESKRAREFRFEHDQKNYVLTHCYLRHMLSQITGIPLNDLQFQYNKYGKPSLIGKPEVMFNLSHSEDQVLIGLAKEVDIGIDIEKIKEMDTAELERRIFSNTERQQMLEISKQDRLNAFYNIWTQKESVVKAIGTGLSESMSDFSVKMQLNEAPYQIIKNETIFFVNTIAWEPQFSAAIALSAPKEHYYYWHIP